MAKTLLLADDSVTIQKVVGISFASEDISITTVDNGDDALIKAKELRPDVVLADVVMPGKSGYEVCEAISSPGPSRPSTTSARRASAQPATSPSPSRPRPWWIA
jgi:CheY-like chemotaxis protein